MAINKILEKEQVNSSERSSSSRVYDVESGQYGGYSIFAEQYLEKPVVSGDKKMALDRKSVV